MLQDHSPRLRVLVADPHADGVASLAMLVRLWGHEVEVARTGPEALAAAAAFRPDVALLDVGLPGTDGCEVARRLRAARHRDRLLLVALTADISPACRHRCHEAGFQFFLPKPSDPEWLQLLLQAWADVVAEGSQGQVRRTQSS